MARFRLFLEVHCGQKTQHCSSSGDYIAVGSTQQHSVQHLTASLTKIFDRERDWKGEEE